MVGVNYEKVVDKISRTASLDREEVKRKIEAKRAKLSDLISYEGAAQIVAVELGISFDNEKLKIDELLPGMRKVGVSGKIIKLFPVRTFKNKQGQDSKVVNLFIADDVSNIKVVLWDSNHIELIENKTLTEGSAVEINNATMKDNELHLGNFSEFKESNEVFENVVTERVVKEKNIVDFIASDNVKTRAFIVQTFDPRFFYVCPECNKKATTDGKSFVCLNHGKVAANKKALMNIVLDDGTETIRAVIFNDVLPPIGVTELDNPEKLISQRENLLGKEMIFVGQIRRNKFFDEEEFIVESVSDLNVEELVMNLEKKV